MELSKHSDFSKLSTHYTHIYNKAIIDFNVSFINEFHFIHMALSQNKGIKLNLTFDFVKALIK